MENNYYDNDSLNNQSDEKRGGRITGQFWVGMLLGLGITAVLMIATIGVSSVLSSSSWEKTKDFLSIGYGQEKEDESVSAAESAVETDAGIDEDTLAKLQMLEKTIDSMFYLHDVTTEELENGIYKGMLEALDDPYSEYYTPEELSELMQQTEGFYYGIGAYVSMDQEREVPKISGVISGTSAEEAELRAEDIIYEIDGESTYGLSLSEVVSRIKGEENTQVLLTIIRDGENFTVPVTRRRVESPTVTYKLMDNDLGYIQITEFSDTTVTQFEDALNAVKSAGVKGLVLDLRGNPGGSLNAVLQIARQMLPEGLIVYTEEKDGTREEYVCDGKNELKMPLAVLVDGNSASASEILAGAIQDYGIGTLIGTTTYGKGIVQQIVPFKDNSAIKITISSYFTPKGRNIHGIGIEPDVECEFDSEAYYDAENPTDNQLEKAKEFLLEKIG